MSGKGVSLYLAGPLLQDAVKEYAVKKVKTKLKNEKRRTI